MPAAGKASRVLRGQLVHLGTEGSKLYRESIATADWVTQGKAVWQD